MYPFQQLLSMRLAAVLVALSVTVDSKIVLRGTNLVEEKGLPDDVARIQEIAEQADKKFYAESRKLLAQMKKKAEKEGRKTHQLIKPLDFDSLSEDVEEFS
jgi:hypothetical protein